jgi:hypothetical protein
MMSAANLLLVNGGKGNGKNDVSRIEASRRGRIMERKLQKYD